jgi:hypothetical protein
MAIASRAVLQKRVIKSVVPSQNITPETPNRYLVPQAVKTMAYGTPTPVFSEMALLSG